MTRCLQALRFVIGLAMLVGGVAVLAPLAGDVFSLRDHAAGPREGEAAASLAPLAIGHAIPDPWPTSTLQPEPLHWGRTAEGGLGGSSPALPPAPVYQPPAPPAPLPAQPAAGVRPTPPLSPTYRSTLAVPPPPLLDAHAPPPLAPGWTSRNPHRSMPPPAAAMPAVPATYAVRDGDDLTSLAVRFYGHPAAAAAIVAANRDRLTDPNILPIGVRLRLPPPWTITAGRTAAESRAIEPGPGIERGPTAQPAGFSPRPTPSTQPWLDAL